MSVLLALVVGSIAGFFYLSYLSARRVEETAINSAHMEAELLERIWGFYSDEVVDRADGKKIRKSHDYASRTDTIPIPATFMLDAGKYVSKDNRGMEVRLYSRYPWRDEGGPRNEFEQRALAALEQKVDNGSSSLSYYELAEKEGHHVVLFAKGQIMKKSCLNCHNAKDGTSPKKNWGEGELAGVLAVTHPLEENGSSVEPGLAELSVLLGSIVSLIAGLSFMLALTARFRAKLRSP